MSRWLAGCAALIVASGFVGSGSGARFAPAPPQINVGAPVADGPFRLAGAPTQGGVLIGTVPRGTMALALDGSPVSVAPDGRFLIAFDRDAKPLAELTATLRDGSTVAKKLVVTPRAWDIQRLDTLPKHPVPEPMFEKLRPAELAQISAARRLPSTAEGWRQPFMWPMTGRISTLFGSQRIYAGEPGSYHSGIDIARPVGTPVLAPADGVVTLATDHPFTLEGNLVLIDHGMGLDSALMHLSRIDVHVGQMVRRGETIGAVGRTGRATGPHLHWGLKWHDARIDPLLVAGPMPATQ